MAPKRTREEPDSTSKRQAVANEDHEEGHEDGEDDDGEEDEAPEEGDEVEISFGDKTPTAEELYEMAAEERADNNDVIAVKLFEMAIAAFKKENAEKDLAWASAPSFQLAWANCLREFGEFYPIREYLEEALQKFETMKALDTLNKAQVFDVYSGLGRSGLNLASVIHEEAVKEANGGVDVNDDGEDDEEEGSGKIVVAPTPAELAAFTKGQDAYNTLVAFTGYPEEQHGNDIALYSKYLIGYCASQDGERKVPLLKNAVELATTAVAKISDHFVHSVKGEAERSLAAALALVDAELALTTVQAAIASYEQALAFAEKEEDVHYDIVKGLADSFILHSTITKNEDESVASYDKAHVLMKQALQLDPENEDLARTVAAMGGDSEQ